MVDEKIPEPHFYTVIARKWRPKTFEEVIGQEYITRTLKNAIKNERIAHAYLFSGPRGIGKTTIARIFAMALNCAEGPTTTPCGVCDPCQKIFNGNDIDCIEIDGASNRGIDEIRNLKERVMLVPSRGRYKVYIIDEVHMLTREAFNALLKTLEEPPPHVIFIFATTEPHKVLDTIVSRCQHFAFNRISIEDISKQLKRIAVKEKIEISEDAIDFIARRSDGALRDAQSLLEKAIAFSEKKITRDNLTDLLNIVDTSVVIDFIGMIVEGKTKESITFVDSLNHSGVDMEILFNSIVDVLHSFLLIKVDVEDLRVLNLSEDQFKSLLEIGDKVDVADVYAITDNFIEAKSRYMRSASPLIALEMAIIRATDVILSIPVEEIVANIDGEISARNIKPDDVENISKKPETPMGVDVEDKTSPDMLDWGNILMIIKQKDASLGGVLNTARCISFTPRELIIGFPENHKFHREEMNKPAKKKFLADLIEKEYGKRPEIKIETVKTDEEKNIKKKIDKEDNEKANRENIPINNKSVDRIVKMFGAKIIEVKEKKNE
jgi:DNA polymerase-3 subunit gamma/tau